jgi:hypothetical protein
MEVGSLPGLLPRNRASVEAVNDPVCNDLVDVGFYDGAGCGCSWMLPPFLNAVLCLLPNTPWPWPTPAEAASARGGFPTRNAMEGAAGGLHKRSAED